MAKRETTSMRIPADLAAMLKVVAAHQERDAVDVLDALLRGPLAKLHRQEVLKSAKGLDKDKAE